MQITHHLRRCFALLLLGLAASAYPQAVNPSGAIPPQTVVMEGRSVIIDAAGATGSVQWQILTPGGATWNDLGNDNTYHGAATRSLEITGATSALDGSSYRFTNTAAGVVSTSNATRLVLSPLLFPSPVGLCLDGSGGLFVSDASTHTIRHIANADLYGWGNITDMHGQRFFCEVSAVAGVSGQTGTADGAADGALFNQPHGLVAAGDATTPALLAADTANGTIRHIALALANVTTLAGSSSLRSNIDGVGAVAQFSTPMGIARAPDGTFFVADSANHTIRKMTADGTVSTFAGSPGNAGWTDGTGSAARFNNPKGIVVDGSGTVFVADTANNLIRRITPAGVVTTLAGVAGVTGAQDGTGGQALFNGPTGLALIGSGVYVADTGNSTIRVVSYAGKVGTVSGTAGVAGLQDTVAGYWSATAGYQYPALYNQPQALAYDNTGLLFIADTGNAAIRVISVYDGWTLTLPLLELPESYAFYAYPAQSTSHPPVTPTVITSPGSTTTTTTSGNSTAAGGGGAPSEWFLMALAGAALLRKWQRRAG